MHPLTRSATIVAVASLLSGESQLGAQTRPFHLYETLTPRQLQIAAGADLDGDGIPDQLVALAGGNGEVVLISGRSGTITQRLESGQPDALGRHLAIVGDLDGDGAADYVVGAPDDATSGPGSGAAWVLSGRTKRLLGSFVGTTPGAGLGPCGALGDVDGDGTADFALAAPLADFPAPDAGVVYVVSGRTFAVIHSQIGSAGQRLGEHMLALPDQNGDGAPDLAASVNEVAGAHALAVVSGRTGLVLRTVPLPFGERLHVLASLGDVNGDGTRDLGAGSTRAGGGVGAVAVLSGNGLGLVAVRAGQANATLGEGIAAAGDVDGDGRSDFAIMTVDGARTRAVVDVVSGASGTVLATLYDRTLPAGEPFALVGAGDVNGDGALDVFTTRGNNVTPSVTVLSTRRFALTAQRIAAEVGRSFEQVFTIDAGLNHARQVFLLLGSASGTSPGLRLGNVLLPLNLDGLLLHSLTLPNLPPYVMSLGLLDASGRGTARFGGFAPPPVLAGLRLHHAALLATRAGTVTAATNAVALAFVDPSTPVNVIEETFATNARLDRERSGGPNYGTLGFVGGSGVHGDFDHTLGTDLGNDVFEFDLQRDVRNGVRGFVVPATHTLTGTELLVPDGAFQFATMHVPAGITVRFAGTTPARILVRGAARIDGVVDVSGATQPQVLSAYVTNGQPGGAAGCGGARGGDGADASDGIVPSNGDDGQDVRVAAGHAYAGRAAGTGGPGALQFPSSRNAITHSYLGVVCAQVPAGAGGGGLSGGGGVGQALQSPHSPPELAPPTPGGSAFQLFPLPVPAPRSFEHFLVGGSGGGGGGSNIVGHRAGTTELWKIGAGGGGGGGAFGLRAGHDLACGAASSLRARGGTHFEPYLHLVQGVPGPAGGGSGGTFVLQSATSVAIQDLDVRGGPGLWVRPGAVQALRIEARGGDGAPGFYRVESPSTRIVNAQPPAGSNNTAPLLDRDPQAGQQSTWYPTTAPFVARFTRFEIDAVHQGVPVRYSDDPAVGPQPRFGDPTVPLWFKLQGARLDGSGNVVPGSIGPWRDSAAALGGDRVNAFRFVLVRNDPQVSVLRVRVLVRD